ncbi:helix-turn-helix domain-containing protein [Natrononativus amylolyticus]|uniref:helix-turn-helix domain-containing protein n=1 Tax=Natrononativus amylolyticus TaxID=2963434 RepID=UPI0020CDC81A|nr:helix-turn-helix domain-containing protein [Natrononativus amylolyticus]
MKKRIGLRLWHEDCWMLALTRRFPGAELVVTDICSDGTDILATVVLTSSGDADLAEVEAAVTTYGSVRSTDVLESRGDSVRIHTRSDANDSIYTTLVSSSLTPIGEVRVVDDREHWTLLADGSEIGQSVAALEEVADVDVRRVIDYKPEEIDAHDLVDELQRDISARQLSYLLSALEEGYYGWPRDVSAKELAEKNDVSAPTALEHLRKGEAAILDRVLRELRDRERRRTNAL